MTLGAAEDRAMSSTGRRIRVAVSVALVAVMLWSTFWGSDDHFPFGPMKMYTTARDLDEPVGSLGLRGVDSDGVDVQLVEELTGMRRAEVEGQVSRFRDDPADLGYLVEAYERKNPDSAPLVEVELYYDWTGVEDGVPTGEEWEEVVATWRS